MSLKYIKRERGSDILVHEGFMYHFEKHGVQKKIWRCVRFKNKCRGRVHIIGDINNEKISKKIDHNHDLILLK